MRSLTARPQAVDAQALSALKRLTDEAATERHTTQTDTDVVYQRQSALNAKSVVTRVEKRATISKEDFESRRDELEGKTFELFHEAPNWTTQDIAVRARLRAVQGTVRQPFAVLDANRDQPKHCAGMHAPDVASAKPPRDRPGRVEARPRH